MTEFISRKHGHSCYEVIIKTTDHKHYAAAEDFARRLIDHAKPMTIADRIRSMSDVELAKWLIKANDGDFYIPFCECRPECNEMLDGGVDIPDESCVACMVRYLQSDYEVERK